MAYTAIYSYVFLYIEGIIIIIIIIINCDKIVKNYIKKYKF